METAIFEDCINLVEKFTENDNPRFESFCEQWKLMMFQHVYSPQTSTIEIILTTKTILHLAKRIVCAKDDVGKAVAQLRNSRRQLLRRIGGMYLMYAIYFKQPTMEYAKILVSPETWRDIITFIEGLPTEPDMEEVRYIFWRLYQSDAYRFTALDFDVGLEDMVDYDMQYDIHQGKEKAEVVRVKLKLKLQTMSEMEKVLPEMTDLEDKYNKIKQSLVGSKKSTMKTLPPTKIFHDIQDVIRNMQDILDEKPREDSYTRSSGINETRKELKRKAAGIVDLGNEKTNEYDSQIEHTSLQDSIQKPRKRLALRNMIRQSLPDHIMDDLNNSSSDDKEDEEITMEIESEEEQQENSDEVDQEPI